MIRDLNPGREARFFHVRPDQPWGPYSLLYNGYRVSFPTVKCPGHGLDQRDLNPGREGNIFPYASRPALGPIEYNGYRVSFPKVKCPGHGLVQQDLNTGREAIFFLMRPDQPWGPYSTMDTGSLPRRLSVRNVALTNPSHLVSKLKKKQSYNSNPVQGLHGLL
jgi:DUF971 family protein